MLGGEGLILNGNFFYLGVALMHLKPALMAYVILLLLAYTIDFGQCTAVQK